MHYLRGSDFPPRDIKLLRSWAAYLQCLLHRQLLSSESSTESAACAEHGYGLRVCFFSWDSVSRNITVDLAWLTTYKMLEKSPDTFPEQDCFIPNSYYHRNHKDSIMNYSLRFFSLGWLYVINFCYIIFVTHQKSLYDANKPNCILYFEKCKLQS